MIEHLLTSLSRMMEQTAGPAMVAAFGWGLLSILLSPCHLASIPLVIAYVNRGRSTQSQQPFLTSLLFSVGIFISVVIIGLITASLGRMLGDIGAWGSWFVAAVFILFGLVLLDVITLPWSGPDMTHSTYRGLFGALVLGLIFGTAVGPCTFAYMAPVLAVVFETASTGWVFPLVLIVLYSVGHCAVIVLAGTLGARLQTFLNWDQTSHLTGRVRKVCGAVLILVGLYLVWKA